ncbi:MAG: hypothetical protein DI539_28095, partial [Flavobacterium psychrophilum]
NLGMTKNANKVQILSVVRYGHAAFDFCSKIQLMNTFEHWSRRNQFFKNWMLPCSMAARTRDTLMIILPFLFLSCSNNKNAKTEISDSVNVPLTIGDTFKLTCNKPSIEDIIAHSDTIYDYPNYKEHTIKSYDREKRLIQVFESNLFESNSKDIFSATTIYDTAGRKIYEDKTKGFIRWHCYFYKFDTKGHLIFKEGYSSGEVGIRVSYIYDNGKLIREVTEHGGQKVETIY